MTFFSDGLVGVGRIDANARDAWGESFGSASGLQLGNWTRPGGPHSFSGSFCILPDRGDNIAPNFSSYAGRIQKIDFTSRPEKGASFKDPAAGSTAEASNTRWLPLARIFLRVDYP